MKNKFIILTLAFILLTPLVLAQEVKEQYKVGDLYDSIKDVVVDYGENFFDGWFGLHTSVPRAFDNLIKGFLAALIVYIVYAVVLIFERRIRKAEGKPAKGFYNPMKDEALHWPSMVSGSLWKIPIFAIFYMVINEIPFISYIVKIIALEIFDGAFILKVFWLAFLLGFLPTLIEKYLRLRFERKMKKQVMHARKVGATVSEN